MYIDSLTAVDLIQTAAQFDPELQHDHERLKFRRTASLAICTQVGGAIVLAAGQPALQSSPGSSVVDASPRDSEWTLRLSPGRQPELFRWCMAANQHNSWSGMRNPARGCPTNSIEYKI